MILVRIEINEVNGSNTPDRTVLDVYPNCRKPIPNNNPPITEIDAFLAMSAISEFIRKKNIIVVYVNVRIIKQNPKSMNPGRNKVTHISEQTKVETLRNVIGNSTRKRKTDLRLIGYDRRVVSDPFSKLLAIVNAEIIGTRIIVR